MNTRRSLVPIAPVLVALIVGCATGNVDRASAAPSSSDGAATGECKLPPQLRRLGHNASYLAAGRIIRTTADDCRVRGGEFKGSAGGGMAAAMPADAVMITIGGDRKTPACQRKGAVAGLKANGTLNVRKGPATSYAKVDQLGNGRAVHFCDWSADETWVGVVYPGPGQADCGVDKPQKVAGPYTGQCRTGWINAQYVRVDD
jgi:hypothetical protein